RTPYIYYELLGESVGPPEKPYDFKEPELKMINNNLFISLSIYPSIYKLEL
ncbi:hypothetical protein LOAG_14659, partial [Loa loa]